MSERYPVERSLRKSQGPAEAGEDEAEGRTDLFAIIMDIPSKRLRTKYFVAHYEPWNKGPKRETREPRSTRIIVHLSD